mmetsp:Transcript_65265/g.103423  ORF Transcript_65265/g.103423 Transcript_65265/m.103423 type:complete len:90 (-) Transcript_65265:224-493(-)
MVAIVPLTECESFFRQGRSIPADCYRRCRQDTRDETTPRPEWCTDSFNGMGANSTDAVAPSSVAARTVKDSSKAEVGKSKGPSFRFPWS